MLFPHSRAQALWLLAPGRTYTRLMLFLFRSSPEGSFSAPSGICARNLGSNGSDTSKAEQTVCSAFDVSDPFDPKFLAQIPLGALKLPSGELRNKKSINLVYVRPGAKSQSA